MMIDFGEDGEPEANTHFATDAHSAAAYTFELPGGGTIEAKQASAKEGLGTGAVQWQSGTALARSLLASEHASRLAGKRVIELGCGCAALPSVVAAVSGAQEVVATDVPALIPLLEANFKQFATTPGVSDANQRALRDVLRARAFDWSRGDDVRALAADPRGFDVVLCADCIDESEALLAALCETMRSSLAPTGIALIATGARSQRLMAIFLAALRHVGLDVTELSSALRPVTAEVAEQRGTVTRLASTGHMARC